MDIDIINERKKALIFKENKIKVHATCGPDTYYNGTIDSVGEDFFFIIDIRFGKKLVLFAELKRGLEPFNEIGSNKRENGDWNNWQA